MAEAKTKVTNASVVAFINAVEDEAKRKDSRTLVKMMREISGERPRMWGGSIVGFGIYTMTYANGKQAEWPLLAFSPRKNALTVYLDCERQSDATLLAKLGKFKKSKACLYIKRLSDIDLDVLRKLVEQRHCEMSGTH